jgi:acetoin utilization deacetylase AcuC-like enzyme
MSGRLPVFYTPRMVARPKTFSPSAAKPVKVVESWQRAGLPVDVIEPVPVTVAQLKLVHKPDYVDDVLACRRANGFSDLSKGVADSLPWTSGAMLSAARHALATGGVACAPCSGFHHARYAAGGGYCTFNGLMLAAVVLQREGLLTRIGIIDCDMHWGDGTSSIIDVLGAEGWVQHFSAGTDYVEPSQAAAFFARLEDEVKAAAACDLVLYQAGADPHVNDPLGGFLTTEELRIRDQIVFQGLARLSVPVAWNLAGGYQQEPDGSIPAVLEIHLNTARESIGHSAGPP